MKMPSSKSQLLALSSGLRCLWLAAFMIAISGRTYGQSSALTECTRAFYSQDYAQAAQLAEKHLSKYPKDVPVRVVLARAELAQGRALQAFEELRRALESDPRSIDALYYLSIVSRELSQSAYQRLSSVASAAFSMNQPLGKQNLDGRNRMEDEKNVE